MSDTYNAVYQAARERIGHFDGQALSDQIARNCDASHAVLCIQQEWSAAAFEYTRPSAVYRPRLSLDGDQWCALYGENLQDGVAGFGDSPAKAMADFDRAWHADIGEGGGGS